MAGFHHVDGLAVGGQPKKIAPQNVPHDEVGSLGKRRIDGGDRVADIALQLVQRLFVLAEGDRIGAGHVKAELIGD